MNSGAVDSRKARILTIALIVVALIGAAALIRHQKAVLGAEKPTAPLPVAVEARPLATTHVTLTLPLVADVQPMQEASIASRLNGYVIEVPYFEGAAIKKGAVLMRLDDADAQSQLLRAEADLARTRQQQASLNADLAAALSGAQAARERSVRTKALYEIKGVSLEQWQTEQSNEAAAEARLAGTRAATGAYRASLQSAEAAVRAARENLAYAVIRAPFDGLLAARLAQPGDLATPGKPLLRLVALGEQRLLVNLPDTFQPVAMRWQSKSLPLTAWPEASAQGMRRYEAHATGPTPGTRLPVEVLTFDGDGLLLPDACLLNNDAHSATVLLLPQSGLAQPITVTLAASGSEGAVSTDSRLLGATIACGGPDVLTRLRLGAPFKIATGR